jgi:hypothetical protein
MKIIITESQYRKLLREIEENVTKIPIPFYMFDWDDNLRYMPTKIYLIGVDEYGNEDEVEMSTEDFAEHRGDIKVRDFEYNGYTIIDYAPDPFRDFKSGIEKFLEDVEMSEKAPAWDKFVKAINNGYYLAIITARGHNPEIIKEAIRHLIDNNVEGIDKFQLFNSLVERKELLKEEPLDEGQEIDDYLDDCLYYTVGYYYPSGGSSKPEEIKAMAMNSFKDDGEYLVDSMNQKLAAYSINHFKFVAKFGFSDDDIKNIKFAIKNTKDIDIIYTGRGKEEKVKDTETGEIDPEFNKEEDLKLENRIRKLLNKL